MLSLPGDQDKEIALLDTYEHSETMDAFLSLISKMEMPSYHVANKNCWQLPAWRLKSLVKFLDKYDCERGLQILRLCALRDVTYPRDVQEWYVADQFLLGAIINYPRLCADAFQRPHDGWAREPVGVHAPSTEPFSTRSAPIQYLCLLPVEYLYALLRTEREGGDSRRRGARSSSNTLKKLCSVSTASDTSDSQLEKTEPSSRFSRSHVALPQHKQPTR